MFKTCRLVSFLGGRVKIWFDVFKGTQHAFFSHFHSDHEDGLSTFLKNKDHHLYTSAFNARVLQACPSSSSPFRAQIHIVSEDSEPFFFCQGALWCQAYPSGHCAGAVMWLVGSQVGSTVGSKEEVVLFTGDWIHVAPSLEPYLSSVTRLYYDDTFVDCGRTKGKNWTDEETAQEFLRCHHTTTKKLCVWYGRLGLEQLMRHGVCFQLASSQQPASKRTWYDAETYAMELAFRETCLQEHAQPCSGPRFIVSRTQPDSTQYQILVPSATFQYRSSSTGSSKVKRIPFRTHVDQAEHQALLAKLTQVSEQQSVACSGSKKLACVWSV